MNSPLLIVGLLTWVAAAFELRSVIRHPTSMVWSYWFVLVFIGMALTIRAPAPGAVVDDLANIPHLSRLIADSCGVLALLAAQNAAYVSLLSSEHLMSRRWVAAASTVVTLILMTALFAWASPLNPAREAWHAYETTAMAAYRLTFLAYLGAAFVILTWIWARYVVLGNDPRSRTAFGFISAGGISGLLYVFNDLGIVFRGLAINPFPGVWGHPSLAEPLLATAIVLVVVGATTHAWLRMADTVRMHFAFLRLRPLWRTLVSACPQVSLLPSRPLWRDVLDIRDADFRLRRQVTEVRDACVVLKEMATPEALMAATDVAKRLSMDEPSEAALVQAALLWTALHPMAELGMHPGVAANLSLHLGWPTLGDARDLWTEVRYLVRVAKHVQGSRPLDHTLEILSSGAQCAKT